MTSLQFHLDHDVWTTHACLLSWRGFQSRQGAYGSQDSQAPGDGTVTVVFAPEGRDTRALHDSEVAMVEWAVANEASMSAALLSALAEKYRQLHDQDPSSTDGFRHLIGLHSLHVHQVSKDGIPYVGFEFGCSWDNDNGLGVLMHGIRVVEIGGADTAILLWIAKADAEQT